MKENGRKKTHGGQDAEYPMRLNRYIARSGAVSRREADALIERGKVRLNGRIAALGDKVEKGDEVIVATPGAMRSNQLYFAANKPKRITSEEIAKRIAAATRERRIFPVLPLESSAEGLVIYSNGTKAPDLPENALEEYMVRTQEPVSDGFVERLRKSLEESGLRTGASSAVSDSEFSISLTVGGGSALKAAADKMRHTVVSLKRTRVGNHGLKGIAPGEWKAI